MNFEDLCTLLDTVDRTRGIDPKKIKLQRAITSWRANVDPSAYPLLRLLTPHLDNERPPYGLKEAKLADYYIDALTLPKGSPDALALKNAHTKGSHGQDFGQLLFQIASSRLLPSPEGDKISLYRINAFLDQLASSSITQAHSLITQAHGEGEDEVERVGKKQLFSSFVAGLSARANKWLSRIILGNLFLGLGDNMILKCYHLEAPQYYNVCSNLKRVVDDLIDPSKTIKPQISVMNAFRPMLAERGADLEDVLSKEQEYLFVEDKLDGERIQLHYDGAEFRMFSRVGNNSTALYSQTFLPFLPSSMKELAPFILDGEILIYDPKEGGNYLPYDSVKSYAVKPRATEDDPFPCLVVFDVLLLKGDLLTSEPLDKRRLILDTLPFNDYLRKVRSQKVTAISEVDCLLQEAIDAKREGIIVKSPNSLYLVGERSPQWTKIKADYLEGINDTLDLVPVGAYLNSERKPIGFLMAIRSSPTELATICKVSSGYNHQELQLLDQLIKPIPAPYIHLSLSKREEAPNIWLEPSLVLECKCHQLVTTDVYSAGLTMRHPRFIRLRMDKSPEQATSIKEAHQISAADKTVLSSTATKKRASTRAGSRKKQLKLAPGYVSSSSSQPPSDAPPSQKGIFDGYEFYLYNAPPQLAPKLRECGAKIVQNPTETTFCVIAPQLGGIRLKNMAREYDIIRPEYLERCIESNAILDYDVSDYLSKKPK